MLRSSMLMKDNSGDRERVENELRSQLTIQTELLKEAQAQRDQFQTRLAASENASSSSSSRVAELEEELRQFIDGLAKEFDPALRSATQRKLGSWPPGANGQHSWIRPAYLTTLKRDSQLMIEPCRCWPL